MPLHERQLRVAKETPPEENFNSCLYMRGNVFQILVNNPAIYISIHAST